MKTIMDEDGNNRGERGAFIPLIDFELMSERRFLHQRQDHVKETIPEARGLNHPVRVAFESIQVAMPQ